MFTHQTQTDSDELVCSLALPRLKGIGNVSARKAIDLAGSATALFDEQERIQKDKRFPDKFWLGFKEADKELKAARRELAFIEANDVQYLHICDKRYPKRLKNSYDAPIILFYKGNIPFEKRCLSIVGTRDATAYGKGVLNDWMPHLKPYDPLIVSGLAYGIDIAAHRAALENNMSTAAVLAHGLDRIYPRAHEGTTQEMLANGGLITDYKSGTNPDRENFPQRNRIVAGMCEGLLVVETAKKGGSMITCELAISNNREVFAVPNAVGSPRSEGCHDLIRQNKAQLCDSPEHLIRTLGWGTPKAAPEAFQKQVFRELNPEEEKVVNYLESNGTAPFDVILRETSLTTNQLSNTLLMLEMEGIVSALSGKRYLLS